MPNIYSSSSDNTVRKIDNNGNQVWSFSGHSNNATNLAVDGEGYVYSGANDDTIKKIDPSGNQVWSQFTGDDVYGVAVDRDGNVYTGLLLNNLVEKRNSSGAKIWTFYGHTSYVLNTAVDKDGNVYSGSYDHTVRKIDPNGNQLWSYGHGGDVWGVAVDKDGNVFTGEYNGGSSYYRKIDSNGNLIWAKYRGEDIRYIAVDNIGNMYHASSDSGFYYTRKLDNEGSRIWIFSHNNQVRAISPDEDGNAYTGEGGGVVRKIDNNGNQVWSFSGHTNDVRGIDVDPGIYGANFWFKYLRDGANIPSTLYLGSTPVSRVYKGNTLVWDA